MREFTELHFSLNLAVLPYLYCFNLNRHAREVLSNTMDAEMTTMLRKGVRIIVAIFHSYGFTELLEHDDSLACFNLNFHGLVMLQIHMSEK